MRTVTALFLVGLIAACPFLCGTAEVGHSAHRFESPSNPPSHEPASPTHCPQDGDDCICNGAVQAGELRIAVSDAVSYVFPLDRLAGSLAHSPSHSLAHLTADGSPAGLVAWGSALAVRAVLQNFRC